MEETGSALILPTCEDIIRLNRRHIETSGGRFVPPDNLLNGGGLEWVLDAIRYPLFGVHRYPTLADKAAVLAWTIIRGHVFHDGCKRTGMAVLEVLLRLNGHPLASTDDEIVSMACHIASGGRGFSYEEFAQWVRERIR
jgi:death-on-curing protein